MSAVEIRVVALALAGALAIHMLWNLWASRLTFELVSAWTPEPVFAWSEPYAHHVVWAASSVVTVVLLLVPGLVLTSIWRRSSPRLQS